MLIIFKAFHRYENCITNPRKIKEISATNLQSENSSQSWHSINASMGGVPKCLSISSFCQCACEYQDFAKMHVSIKILPKCMSIYHFECLYIQGRRIPNHYFCEEIKIH
ncbi:hypothetical protein CEXT_120841 [Caerostris extrusa]|uniref:Uncharacterized protein n=1 Tax=Caerostris extrusa TaxID=172846 RepID=A0AAV4TLB5_CAEEX|nr:hypothetical protein CEXT_120841 [Caerostris extrusa]